MKILIIFILSLTSVSCNLLAQPYKLKQDLYFIVDSSSKYIQQYRKVDKNYKFDLTITFNKRCMILNQQPMFYRFRDSIQILTKRIFLKRNFQILSYKQFMDIICNAGNDVKILTNYNVFFIEKKTDNKYLLYRAFCSTPLVEN